MALSDEKIQELRRNVDKLYDGNIPSLSSAKRLHALFIELDKNMMVTIEQKQLRKMENMESQRKIDEQLKDLKIEQDDAARRKRNAQNKRDEAQRNMVTWEQKNRDALHLLRSKQAALKQARDVAIGVGVTSGVLSIFTFGISAVVGAASVAASGGAIAGLVAMVDASKKTVSHAEDHYRDAIDQHNGAEGEYRNARNMVDSYNQRIHGFQLTKMNLEAQDDQLETELDAITDFVSVLKEATKVTSSLMNKAKVLAKVVEANKELPVEWQEIDLMASLCEEIYEKYHVLVENRAIEGPSHPGYLGQKAPGQPLMITRFHQARGWLNDAC